MGANPFSPDIQSFFSLQVIHGGGPSNDIPGDVVRSVMNNLNKMAKSNMTTTVACKNLQICITVLIFMLET